MNFLILAQGSIESPLTLGAIFGSLVLAVGTLWKVLHAQNVKTEQRLTFKLDECETKHGEVNSVLLEMATDLGELKGKQDGINLLAKQVLHVVAKKTSATDEPTKE